MRCADFGPTPGKQRKESISRANVGVYFIEDQNGSFMPGGRLRPDMSPEYFS